MTSLKKLSMLAIALVIGVVMMSCSKEGPAGPAGTNGKDGGQTCGVCHSNTNDKVNTNWSQYEISRHGTGIIFEEEGGRLGCAACHTGQGYAEAADAGKDDPTIHATGPIDCKACHPIHSTYTEADFSLRQKTGFNMRITGAAIDYDKSNTCSRCHQGRAYVMPAGDTTLKTTGSTTYSRFGPHYGTPTNVYSMNGPYAITGSQTVPSTNVHGSLANKCISCHMGSVASNPAIGGHTFVLPASNYTIEIAAECKTCHVDPASQFKALAVAAQVKRDLALYRAKLIEKGMLDTTQAIGSDGTYNVLGEYLAQSKTGVAFKGQDLKVAVNYLYLVKDKSNGAHNPAYIKALLTNGLEYLNQ